MVCHAYVSPCMGRVDWNLLNVSSITWFTGSLPVWGEWIEIILNRRKKQFFSSLSLYGESGLKSCTYILLLEPYTRLSLYGESGLKFIFNWDKPWIVMSLPVWGEWIEITGSIISLSEPVAVSPCMGRVDWNNPYLTASIVWLCLSLYGESGLKSW